MVEDRTWHRSVPAQGSRGSDSPCGRDRQAGAVPLLFSSCTRPPGTGRGIHPGTKLPRRPAPGPRLPHSQLRRRRLSRFLRAPWLQTTPPHEQFAAYTVPDALQFALDHHPILRVRQHEVEWPGRSWSLPACFPILT